MPSNFFILILSNSSSFILEKVRGNNLHLLIFLLRKVIENFQVASFCLMNQDESICRSYRNDTSCFNSTIPIRFSMLEKTKDYCSFKFPPGYSIYIEEFILENAGPNNFVLLDGKHLEYSWKLKWTKRRNIFWDRLEKGHPLKEKTSRRSNFQCINLLKVNEHKSFFRKKEV